MIFIFQSKSFIAEKLISIKGYLSAERQLRMPKFFGQFPSKANKNLPNYLNKFINLDVFFHQIQPLKITNLIRNLLIILCILTLVYACFAIVRLPVAVVFNRPPKIYQLQDIQKVNLLFGQQEIDLSKIKLTGLMINGAPSQGIAIFEIDGKSSGAVAVGEVFDKGYFLQGLSQDKADIVYQGKQYQLTINKKTIKNLR
jgi:hypothetical protein